MLDFAKILGLLSGRSSRGTGTPQGIPLPGRDQVRNSAGGFVFEADDWTRLDRFLVLGSEGGSYYAGARQLTREAASASLRCLEADGPRVVRRVVELSEGGRGARNDSALFLLALAASAPDPVTRKLGLEALPRVARTGTHLFQFVQSIQGLRGWGRALKRAVGAWYQDKTPERLAYQLVKYRQRQGWTHRDLLRLAKPVPRDPEHAALYRWVVGKGREGDLPEIVEGFEAARSSQAPAALAELVRRYRLPREALPTEALRSPRVWEALLPDMPLGALVRNLGNLGRHGLLVPGSPAEALVTRRLGDREALGRARLHPFGILQALVTYQSGKGARGTGSWSTCARVVDALDAAFYASFGNAPRAGRRFLLAVDVSGSMCAQLMGSPVLSCRSAAAAMALVTLAREPACQVVAFCNRLVPVDLSPRQRLDDVVRALDRRDWGATDCALPMLWAREQGLEVDCFVVYTDSETWFGKVHPSEALRQYREATGIPARLAVVGLVGNRFSLADPEDPGMLDVVGFDSRAPEVLTGFARG